EAARALEPIAGRFASALFAAGIVGTGLLAIPTLAGSAAYALAETFGLREGLGRKLKDAPGFYGVLAASIAIGLGLNFVGIDPIRALYVSAILNGLAAPPLILLMLILSRSRRAELRTGWLSDGLMVIALLVMSASAAVYLIGSLVGWAGQRSEAGADEAASREARPSHRPCPSCAPRPAVAHSLRPPASNP